MRMRIRVMVVMAALALSMPQSVLSGHCVSHNIIGLLCKTKLGEGITLTGAFPTAAARVERWEGKGSMACEERSPESPRLSMSVVGGGIEQKAFYFGPVTIGPTQDTCYDVYITECQDTSSSINVLGIGVPNALRLRPCAQTVNYHFTGG